MESFRIFWVWWRDQLLASLPGHEERRRQREADALVLSRVESDGVETSALVTRRLLAREETPEPTLLDRATADRLREEAMRANLPVVLRLPETWLLERDVTLPIAAERGLNQVLYHEMDRFTPFSAAELFWSARVLERDRAQGKLTARLSMVPHALAANAVGLLGRAGLAPDQLELVGPDGALRRIVLGRPATAGRIGKQAAPLLALAGLLVLALVAPFLWQARAFSAVNARIANAAPAVSAVQRLRAGIAAGATGAAAVAAERRRVGDALHAVAMLTDAIPDDTYLTGLTYDAGTLTLDGQSKSAAGLIGPLTADPHFADATFTAPVVRNALGLDSFSLKLRVAK